MPETPSQQLPPPTTPIPSPARRERVRVRANRAAMGRTRQQPTHPSMQHPLHRHSRAKLRHSRGRGNPENCKARRSSASTVERPAGERNETTEMPASAQVMNSTPNFYRLEIACPELPYYNAALTPALDVRNGFYHVSDAPGHGPHPKPRLRGGGAGQVVNRLRTDVIPYRHPRSCESRKPILDGRGDSDAWGATSARLGPAASRNYDPNLAFVKAKHQVEPGL